MIPSTKPKQREFLRDLIDLIHDRKVRYDEIERQLRILRRQLHNRPQHKGRRTAPPTRKIKPQILALHRANPDLSNQEIAIMLNISSGRVSEALYGKKV